MHSNIYAFGNYFHISVYKSEIYLYAWILYLQIFFFHDYANKYLFFSSRFHFPENWINKNLNIMMAAVETLGLIYDYWEENAECETIVHCRIAF